MTNDDDSSARAVFAFDIRNASANSTRDSIHGRTQPHTTPAPSSASSSRPKPRCSTRRPTLSPCRCSTARSASPPGHSPLIGRLGYGEMRIRRGSDTERFYVDGGFVQVADNVVSVLTNRAVPARTSTRPPRTEQLRTALARPAAGRRRTRHPRPPHLPGPRPAPRRSAHLIGRCFQRPRVIVHAGAHPLPPIGRSPLIFHKIDLMSIFV